MTLWWSAQELTESCLFIVLIEHVSGVVLLHPDRYAAAPSTSIDVSRSIRCSPTYIFPDNHAVWIIVWRVFPALPPTVWCCTCCPRGFLLKNHISLSCTCCMCRTVRSVSVTIFKLQASKTILPFSVKLCQQIAWSMFPEDKRYRFKAEQGFKSSLKEKLSVHILQPEVFPKG